MNLKDLQGKNVSVTMESGDRRQGKLINVDEASGTFTIHWRPKPKDDEGRGNGRGGGNKGHFFRTEMRLDRLESCTEQVFFPDKGTDEDVPSEL